MSRVRMGVVGLGQWGRHHVRILAQLPSVDLVGVVDRDGREAIHLAHRFETRPYEDHRDLLGKVDAVSIAVPTALHYQITRDFLEAGAHVLVEKPMTVTAEEAAHLVDLVARLRMTTGCLVTLTASRVAAKKTAELEVTMADRAVHLDLLRQTITIHHFNGEIQRLTVEGEEPLELELRHFVECVRGGARPLVTGEDGLRSLQVTEALLARMIQIRPPIHV